jgi:restriction system protein
LQAVRATREHTISEGLRKIDWFQFEKLVELIYQRRGFAVTRLGGANPDGGVDLILKSEAEEIVVQCKHWRKQMVGIRDIREFLGTLTDQKIAKGIFVTLAGYTEDAQQLAHKHGIQIYKETDIINLLEESGLTYSREISDLFSDETKTCPRCKSEMILRTARGTGKDFWGCSRFPRCRCIINLEG